MRPRIDWHIPASPLYPSGVFCWGGLLDEYDAFLDCLTPFREELLDTDSALGWPKTLVIKNIFAKDPQSSKIRAGKDTPLYSRRRRISKKGRIRSNKIWMNGWKESLPRLHRRMRYKSCRISGQTVRGVSYNGVEPWAISNLGTSMAVWHEASDFWGSRALA